MPFCIKCGEKLEGDANFCPECGHKVGLDVNNPNINNNQNKGIGQKIMEFNLGKSIGKSVMNYGAKKLEEEKMEIRQRISPLLPKYAKMLGVTPEECYVTSMTGSFLFRGTQHRGATRKGVVIAIYDNKISYIEFANIFGNTNFFESNDINSISFKNIINITNNPTYITLNMNGNTELNIRPTDYFNKKISNELHEKYNNFISTSNATEINNSSKPTAADELLKYAELYKQGFLTEEEFEAKKKELL